MISDEINVSTIVKKVNGRMKLLMKIASFGKPADDLQTIYILYIISILEQSAPVWQSSLIQDDIDDLERVQKSAIKVILNEKYTGFGTTWPEEQLCFTFAPKMYKQWTNEAYVYPESKISYDED